jgi:predicted nucleic acid-binding protein
LKAVCNTSPLILLSKIEKLGLIFQLFGNVIAPQAVIDEIKAGSDDLAHILNNLIDVKKLIVRKAGAKYLKDIPFDIGAGEREAIALALETAADIIIIDDHLARNVSRGKGLKITGTIGILIEAKSRGLIKSLRNELDSLIESGMWIKETFYHRLLQEFGE